VFGNAVGLRQINTTGNLRMAAMCELPDRAKSADLFAVALATQDQRRCRGCNSAQRIYIRLATESARVAPLLSEALSSGLPS
jgi:hypothetical protein